MWESVNGSANSKDCTPAVSQGVLALRIRAPSLGFRVSTSKLIAGFNVDMRTVWRSVFEAVLKEKIVCHEAVDGGCAAFHGS